MDYLVESGLIAEHNIPPCVQVPAHVLPAPAQWEKKHVWHWQRRFDKSFMGPTHILSSAAHPTNACSWQMWQCTMSQTSNNLKLVSRRWQCVHCPPVTPTVTRSQSSRAALGYGGTGDSHHAADKSAATGDAIVSRWTRISEEGFQHLVELMTTRIEAVLEAKWSNLVLARWSW